MTRFRGVLSLFLLGAVVVTASCTTDPGAAAPGDPGESRAELHGAQLGPSNAWFDKYPALTVTLVRGADPARVVREMYPDGLTEVPDASRAAAVPTDHAWLAAGSIDDWVFVWENNGFQGSDVKRAEALSQGTRLVSAFWNDKDVAVATIAENGAVTRQFEPANRTDPQNTIGRPLPAEDWLDWEHDRTGAMLQLQAEVTGQATADPSWLKRPGVRFWTYPLADE
jgi:hypothetical protein